VLGQIAGAHGLRGEVRVHFFGDAPENLMRVPEIWLGEAPDALNARHFEVAGGGSGRGGEVRLALVGIDDREAALALRKLFVLADADALAPLDADEFYWHELVGCLVVSRDGRAIGTVREIWETGGHDVLVVEGSGGERHLLSTARELMPEIDRDARRIVVEILPGMLED
jgi:16S rRNA processing protein RimM